MVALGKMSQCKYIVSYFLQSLSMGASEMAQHEKVFATKPDDLNSIQETHTLEVENKIL